MTAGRVKLERAGRDTHEIFLTDVRSLKENVDNRVRLYKSKAPPTEPKVVLPRLVKAPASWQMKSPVICSGPSRLITPAALGPMRTEPSMVEQEAYCVASACELMVAVDWEQREAVWAAATLRTAKAGRSFWAIMLIVLCCCLTFSGTC